MGRRRSDKLPEIRLHKPSGNARIFLNGREYWLGRFGSPEAKAQYDVLMAGYIASGRTSVEAVASPAAKRTAPAAPAGLTIGELALRWIEDIEATKPNYRSLSVYHGALAASRAIRPLAAMPVEAFGSRALLEVQRLLVDTPVVPPKRKTPAEDPPKPKRRSRRYINDTIGRVRQMFNWGVLHELVPDDRVKALEIVPALTCGSSRARETKPVAPVKASVVQATLPYLTSEVADMVWFIRLTGCRPSEARRMKLCRIRDRNRAVWRYVPKRHKNSHKKKQRHIAIGPQGQAIILAHTAGRYPTEYVFTPRRSVPRNKDGTPSARKPSPRVGARFTKDVLARAIRRACIDAGIEPWTPYQLRYLRLGECRRQGGREMARSVAGHSNATMTDHYAPPGWGRARKAALKGG